MGSVKDNLLQESCGPYVVVVESQERGAVILSLFSFCELILHRHRVWHLSGIWLFWQSSRMLPLHSVKGTLLYSLSQYKHSVKRCLKNDESCPHLPLLSGQLWKGKENTGILESKGVNLNRGTFRLISSLPSRDIHMFIQVRFHKLIVLCHEGQPQECPQSSSPPACTWICSEHPLSFSLFCFSLFCLLVNS